MMKKQTNVNYVGLTLTAGCQLPYLAGVAYFVGKFREDFRRERATQTLRAVYTAVTCTDAHTTCSLYCASLALFIAVAIVVTRSPFHSADCLKQGSHWSFGGVIS